MRHLNSFQLTRFVELLTTTKLFYDTRLIEFAFEFLNRALDVLTFFNRNDNHCLHLLSRVNYGSEPFGSNSAIIHMYPGPGSNRHGFPLVFETNASTNSATWASRELRLNTIRDYVAHMNSRLALALPKNRQIFGGPN